MGKKFFLFSLFAFLAAGFGFGGVSLADSYVASIGNNDCSQSTEGCYTTLDAAIEAANDGATVKLLSNASTYSIVIDKKLTLDLGGHTLRQEIPAEEANKMLFGSANKDNDNYFGKIYKNLISITSHGDLTITGDGKILGPTDGKHKEGGEILDGKVIISVEGKLTYLNGEMVAGGAGSDGMYGVYILDNGTAIFGDEDGNGPIITSHFAAIGTNNTTAPANVIVYGGTYEAKASTPNAWWQYFCAPIYAAAAGTFDIQGGTLKGYFGISSRYSNVEQDIILSTDLIINSNSDVDIFVGNKSGVASDSDREIIVRGSSAPTFSIPGESTSDIIAGEKNNYKWVKNGNDWKLGHTVTLNCKETCPDDYTTSIDVVDTQTFSRPDDPVKDNSKFAGWYKEEALTSEYDFDTPVTADITLYGEFRDPVIVKFMDGETELEQTIAKNTKATEPEEPVKDGYTFLGWFKGEETSPFDFDTAIAENTTLTAKWHQKSTLSTNIGELDFEVGVPVEFTFTAAGYDDKNIMVKGTSNFSNAAAIDSLEYFEVNQASCGDSYDTEAQGCWLPLVGDHFGPATGFPMPEQPFSSKFRVTFNTAGEYSFTASMKKVADDSVLCDTEVTFTVNPKTYTIILDSTVSNGTISTTPADKAAEGATVTLTATPASNYNFGSWTVKDADNGVVTVTNNTFTMPAKNVTVSATFTVKPSSSSSGGGGGSSKKSETTKTDDAKANTGDTATVDDKNAEDKNDETKADEPKTAVDANNNGTADTAISFSQEFKDAYKFAHENGITTKDSIEEADMYGPLTRIAMAKMLSQYAINVLGKTPDTSKVVPNFPDVDAQLDADYNNGVTLAYQLGIMGIGIEEFRPFDLVTRAEFGTALSRMLYGTADGEGNEWYSTHLEKLMNEKIITNDNPQLKELRGYVMIMLMRSAKQ